VDVWEKINNSLAIPGSLPLPADWPQMEGVGAGKMASTTSVQDLLVHLYLPIIKTVFYCRCLQGLRQALPTPKKSAVKKIVV